MKGQEKGHWAVKLLKTFKYLCAITLVVVFTFEALQSVTKLKDEKMTFTSVTQIEPNFTFPSVTVCVANDETFTGGPQNNVWPSPQKYQIEFPFAKLGYISDSKYIDG